MWVTRPEVWYSEEDGGERADLDPANRLDPGGWWTCHPTTAPGDLALIYRAGRKAGFGRDIAYLAEATSYAYALSGDPYARRYGWDVHHGCDHRMVYKFEQSLALEDLRKIPRLEDWGALRGNFQRSVFAIPSDHWSRITRRAIQKDRRYERVLKQLAGPPRPDTEKQIEDWLARNLDKLSRFGYRGVRLYRDPITGSAIGRQFVCPPVGRIDLLCEYGRPKRFLVIEIKNVQATLRTFAQAMSYRNWIKQHLAGRRAVDVLVVSRGAHPAFDSAINSMSTVERIDVAELPRRSRRAA